jgi:hypothetical protein
MSAFNNCQNVITPFTEGQALYNCKIKRFPGFCKMIVFSHSVFNPLHHELKKKKIKEKKQYGYDRGFRMDNVNRARDKAFDIAYSNTFDYFITFTLDASKIDRFDKPEVMKKLKVWLSDRVQRNGLKYVIFPEYHKNGAIHFHGLCSGELKLVDSGKKTRAGQTIYNSESWKYGFSSVVKLEGPYTRVVNYIIKYVSKENCKVFGKWYLSGGKGLKREVPTEYLNIDFSLVDAKTYHIPNVGLSVKYLTIFDK